MKKALMLILALVLALTAAAFVACSDAGTDGTDGTGNDTTNGTDDTGIDQDTDPSTIVSDTMTEAEWTAAFADESFNNYTMSGKMTQSTDSASYSSDILVKYAEGTDATLFYMQETSTQGTSTESYEEYYEITASATYSYSKEDDVWVKSTASYDPSSGLSMYTDMLAGGFSQLSYSDADKAYTAENYTVSQGSSTQTVEATVKFTDKKVSYIKYVSPVMSDSSDSTAAKVVGTMTIELKYYDYGKTSVTLPQVSQEGNNQGNDPSGDDTVQITQAQWKAAFSESALSNFSVEGTAQTSMSYSGQTLNGTSTIEMQFDIGSDHDYRYMLQETTSGGSVSNTEVYTSTKNGVITLYEKDSDGQWKSGTTYSETLDLSSFYAMANVHDYTNVTYDSQNGQYVVDEFTAVPAESCQLYVKFNEDFQCTYIKIVATNPMYGSGRYAEGTVTVVYNLTYGTADITLPAVG